MKREKLVKTLNIVFSVISGRHHSQIWRSHKEDILGGITELSRPDFSKTWV